VAHRTRPGLVRASRSSLTRCVPLSLCSSTGAAFQWCMVTTSTATAGATTSLDPPQVLRRRRRRNDSSTASTNNTSNAATSASSPSHTREEGGAFAPKDSDGNLLTSQEYLKLASLSPWVPCPDIVIKRVLEIANATESDIHGDLGCGDGRFNFAAISGPFNVSKSWGVDVDTNILEKCHERLGKRFVPRSGDLSSESSSYDSDAERLEFHQADLIQVIERQKQKYQSRHSQHHTQPQQQFSSDNDWSKEDSITDKISSSTIITMYFVNDALTQIKSFLECTLGGKSNVRVITVGYEMHGWDATWVERVLGLTIFKYDMENVSKEPMEWRVGDNDNVNDGSAEERRGRTMIPNEQQQLEIDGDAELSQLYLQQKRDQDIEELNAGLRIHHDENLNEFAQARSSSVKAASQQGSLDAASMTEEWESVDGGWDFDETEDPDELIREAHKARMENARTSRGRGIMAGLDEWKEEERSQPIWKKP
jgi:hypothetical protein